MEISGLPLHALILHAAVVLAPLAVVIAWAFALLPSWRWLSRWPAVVMAVVTLVTIFVTRLSGQSLLEDRFDGVTGKLASQLETHQSRANTLFLLTVVFTVVVLAAGFMLGGRSGHVSGKGAWADRGGAVAARALPVLVVLAGLLVLVWVFLTGDAGARAVWSQ